MTAALLAEVLLLLLLDDDDGTTPGMTIDPRVPLGAAVLAEPAIDGAVELEPATSRWRMPKVQAGFGRVDDDVLAVALRIAAEKLRTAKVVRDAVRAAIVAATAPVVISG